MLLAAYFIYLQWAPVFPDPDSFYHTKMAILMSQQGLITSFPWIKYTSFTINFTDHHFLYHVLLIPFVKFFDPLIGMKIATTLLAWLAIFSFYVFLKKFKIRFALLHTLVLVSVVPFIFRMNLAKTSSISLIILLLAIFLTWQKKYSLLTVTSFFYVWTYGGWSIVLVFLACQILAQIITSTAYPNSNLKKIIKSLDWKLILSVCFGCLLGLIINPYFPHNLYFYWEQVIQIGLFNYQGTIPVGQEWYPFNPADLISALAFALIVGILSFLAFFVRLKQNRDFDLSTSEYKKFQNFFALFLFASFLAIMTLKSMRFIEYLAPFIILANALLLDFSLPNNFSIKTFINQNIKNKYLIKLLIIPIVLFLSYLVISGIELHKQMTDKFSWNYLKGSALWLKNNTPERSLVFHSIWSDSTILFLNNDHNVYVAGLDPTFFYRFDPKLYEEWSQIRAAKIGKSLPRRLKNDFQTNYILIKLDETPLLQIVENDKNFNLRYQDNEAKIFEVR